MKKFAYILITVFIVGVLSIAGGYFYATSSYAGHDKRVNIGRDLNIEQIHNVLCDSLGRSFGDKVFNLWRLRKGALSKAHGSYIIPHGQSAFSVAMRLRGGMQTPVTVTVPNLRDTRRVIDVVASNFEFAPDQLSYCLDSILTVRGMDERELPAIILPDTYQYYWTSSPRYVAEFLMRAYDNFWNKERKEKASRLHLTPVAISTLASIVEEESSKSDERPIIARLYLNRLDRGMRLQADPTVKFAVGDPTLKRILNIHLTTSSPYNTYMNDGLPPGPIRVVDKSTIDAVLNAPFHNYIYMCAKEDFSGYHNFAATLSEHNLNAQKYHQALNKNNIK